MHEEDGDNDLTYILNNDEVVDNEKAKDKYMRIIDFSIGKELNELSNRFNNPRGSNADEQTEDKYLIAQRIKNMSKRSVKFTEWIAPEYNIDIDEAKNFIDQIKGKPQRAHKAPDVFSPAKELEREKELKEATKSKLPVPVAPTRKREATAIWRWHN